MDAYLQAGNTKDSVEAPIVWIRAKREAKQSASDSFSGSIETWPGRENGNPDHATVKWVIASREKNDDFTFVFTYDMEEIDARREAERRGGWDYDEMPPGLCLKSKKADGYRFSVRAGAPTVVDLKDERTTW